MSVPRDLSRYENRSQQTLLKVLTAMAHRPVSGMTFTQLKAALPDIKPDPIYRAAINLQIFGWAESAPGGGWRLTPAATLAAERMRIALGDMHRAYLGVE